MPLYVTVTPGLSVTDTTTLDTAAINQIGSPTVDITGTLDGSSSLVIGAGSVVNSQLASMTAQSVKGAETTGVPIDATLDTTLAISAGVLKVADYSLKAIKLEPISAGTFVGAVNSTHIADGVITVGKVEPIKALTLMGNPGPALSASPETIGLGSGLTFTGSTEIAISTRARASNLVTITTGSAHGYTTGDYVSVSGIGSGFDAYHVAISVTGSTTFTYTNYGANVSVGGAGTSYVRKISPSTGVPSNTISITNNSPFVARAWINMSASQVSATYGRSGTTITVTTATAHGMSNGYYVRFVATSGGATSAWYLVGGVTSNTFTITDSSSGFIATGNACTLDCFMRAGQNISQVTRNGTGDYTIQFTTAMSSADYCVQAFCNSNASSVAGNPSTADASYMTTTSARILVGNTTTGVLQNTITYLCVLVFAN